MKRARRSRTLAVLVLAVVAHGVLFALLAIKTAGFVFRPQPAPERLAIDVTLASPVVFPPLRARKPAQAKPTPAPPASQPAAQAPTVAQTELPNLAKPVFRVWPRALPGGVNWGGFDVGCDDPAAHHLTAAQREHCRTRWGEPSQQIAEIAPLIGKEKQAEFERRIWCRDKYELAGVPIGAAEDFRQTLGHIPSMKECPLEDR